MQFSTLECLSRRNFFLSLTILILPCAFIQRYWINSKRDFVHKRKTITSLLKWTSGVSVERKIHRYGTMNRVMHLLHKLSQLMLCKQFSATYCKSIGLKAQHEKWRPFFNKLSCRSYNHAMEDRSACIITINTYFWLEEVVHYELMLLLSAKK